MKKEKKTNRINFRYSNEEWAFYQSLKESGLKRFMMRLAMLSKLIDNKIDVIFIKSVEFYIKIRDSFIKTFLCYKRD